MLIALSGIAPDLDGVGLLIDPVARQFGQFTNYWGLLHHQLHNIGFCVLLTIVGFVMAKVEKLKVAVFVFAIFHLYLLCDLIGSRGPDGYQWPIPYLLPFTNKVQLTWQHQWELNAWPNILIGVVLVGIMIVIARVKERSPFEMVSKKVDTTFINIVKRNHIIKQ